MGRNPPISREESGATAVGIWRLEPNSGNTCGCGCTAGHALSTTPYKNGNPAWHSREVQMSDSVYKVVTLIGTSTESWRRRPNPRSRRHRIHCANSA